jgi:hypothetical protein
MDSNHKDDLQARFDAQADDLDLQPEAEKGGWGEERTVGLAFGMHTVVDATPDKSKTELGDDDREAIAGIVRTYIQAHPHEFFEQWRSLATDPFIVFGFGYVVEANEETVQDWKNNDVKHALSDCFHDPRRVEISDLRILDLGAARAGATYHISEEFTDGSTESGHQMAILMCVENVGWRIVGVTKSHHAVDEIKDMKVYANEYKGESND